LARKGEQAARARKRVTVLARTLRARKLSRTVGYGKRYTERERERERDERIRRSDATNDDSPGLLLKSERERERERFLGNPA
jgi:hypothetical protein